LRDFVQAKLEQRWSPQQICHALQIEFPGQPERHLVHETIYQALYVQGRGELRRELTRALRTGRARRKPHRRGDARRQGSIVDASVMISERPAEADDRAIPGHWEGDLITGEGNRSAIGTLVERSTRYVMLLHLPTDHTAEAVRDALTRTVMTLPAHLRRSLTWDQGLGPSGRRNTSRTHNRRPDSGRPLSDLDGASADAADLELPASPPGDRHEEHRELLDLSHLRPPCGVAAVRAGADIPKAQVLLLDAEAEEEEHVATLRWGDRCAFKSLREAPLNGLDLSSRRTLVPAWQSAGAPITALVVRRPPEARRRSRSER